MCVAMSDSNRSSGRRLQQQPGPMPVAIAPLASGRDEVSWPLTYHDCQTRGGFSGAPLYYLPASGGNVEGSGAVAVGMHVAGSTHTRQYPDGSVRQRSSGIALAFDYARTTWLCDAVAKHAC
jgi:hypothetical protein